MKMQDYVFWNNQDGNLMLGKETVSSLARKFGTSLYLYDANIALNRLSQIKKAFPGFDILYSMKTNPNPLILRLFARGGTGADVASLQELKFALENGFSAEKITYGGPAKLSSHLKAAIEANVGFIDAESERELQILEKMGPQNNRKISTTFRVNIKG